MKKVSMDLFEQGDHIKPLFHFDLSDEKQLKQAVHYTNLQPMRAIENLKKNSKYTKEKTNDNEEGTSNLHRDK